MNVTQANRLLTVTQALRELTPKQREEFDTGSFRTCSLAMWARRRDLQRVLRPGNKGVAEDEIVVTSRATGWFPEVAANYFGLTGNEFWRLFGARHRTVEKAIKGIEGFIKNKGFDLEWVDQ